jgi:NTE family protein
MSLLARLREQFAGPRSVGVALAGGGVRGFAHLGVLEVLVEAVPVSRLAGASAGALVGALWSAGVPRSDILDAVRSFRPFRPWRAAFLEAGLLDPDYFREHWLRRLPERFEDLEVPLTVVATHLETGDPTFFDAGPLREAVLASCALPPLYGPIDIEGVPYVDGGLAMNLPVTPLSGRGEAVVASEVNPRRGPQDGERATTLGLVSRGLELVFKAATAQETALADVVVTPEGLDEVFLLDTAAADEAYRLGAEGMRAALRRPEVRRRLGV